MKKLLCAVLVSSLLLSTLAGAASSPLTSSLDRHQAQVLGLKGRGHYQHLSRNMQQQQPEEVTVEVKKPTETTTGGWTVDKGEDDAEEGLIYSADYSAVAMHAGSPPKHKHPKP
ncbi:unnamed protein product [Urochloa decumbens]|uniref:Uncharacterized protein n=1 Tax=Urochloa decumbens TaxID=240449 RepID=A0ABC9D1N3_9POAL